jgi:hypothetical protein
MKTEKQPILLLVLATISLMFTASFAGTARAQSSTVFAITPSNYTYYANYTTPPTTLIFNITLTDITNLAAWQVGIQWDPAILTYNNLSIPTNNIFAGQSILTAGPDNTNPAIVVYSAALAPGGAPFTGSGIVAQLELNVTQAALVPPASSTIAFEGVGIDTFLLDNDGVDILSTKTNSMFTNTYLTGDIVTHTIAGSSNPVVTQSNGTVEPNSAGIDTVTKTISFNVTGNTGDTAFLYAILPKDVINVTAFINWNVTVNGVLQPSPQITENATHTFVYATFPFASQVTLGVQGNWIIPELSSMLIILIIASSATVAIAKSRTRRK